MYIKIKDTSVKFKTKKKVTMGELFCKQIWEFLLNVSSLLPVDTLNWIINRACGTA